MADRKLFDKYKSDLLAKTFIPASKTGDRSIKYFWNTDGSYDFFWKGVYLIGYNYIGRSSNIDRRLREHACSLYHTNNPGGKMALRYWFDNYPGLKIPVKVLSFDPEDEKHLIKKYVDLGFPLLNKIGI